MGLEEGARLTGLEVRRNDLVGWETVRDSLPGVVADAASDVEE